jgi:hypothetical protein
MALIIGDSDVIRLTDHRIGGRDIDVESDLRDATRSRRNAKELRFAEKVIVLDPRMPILVHLNKHIKPVTSVCQEVSGRVRTGQTCYV